MPPNPGDELRDTAALLLSLRFGRPVTEKRAMGKKVDVYFEIESFGKKSKLYVEAKDYSRRLSREDVVKIWSDYSGIISKNSPSVLLLVTKLGLTTDADVYVRDEQADMRHQTIREVENEALGIDGYVRSQTDIFDSDSLSQYYVPARARAVEYDKSNRRLISPNDELIFEKILDWIRGDSAQPLAILGGYGAGKSSLAKRLMSHQSRLAVEDSAARRPVLIKLGGLTRYSSIEGLLGGMFTSEYPTPNFNFHTFEKLNNSGRLIIILDGFDEMKHAMTWSDFKNQIKDLNRLTKGDSRVILLGRPTAFLSYDEHLLVLRGLQKIGAQLRSNIDWPKFDEFELCEFTPEESVFFIRSYLPIRIPNMNDGEYLIVERIQEVTKIVKVDHELFAKPVHLKILVDLAADLSINLQRFEGGLSRWDLYQVFLVIYLIESRRKRLVDRFRLQGD